jgi:hypothetical protein
MSGAIPLLLLYAFTGKLCLPSYLSQTVHHRTVDLLTKNELEVAVAYSVVELRVFAWKH